MANQKLKSDIIRNHWRYTSSGPFEGEKYREKDGLVLDTGDFCCIIKDETTDLAQEVIKRSNLCGTPFWTESWVPSKAFLRAVPGVHSRYVDIDGLVVESSVLAKLLNVIGEWDVEFYRTPSNELLGIKAREESYSGDKQLDQRTVNKGVIDPQEIPWGDILSVGKLTFNVEIPTLKEQIAYYINGTRIKPEFSLGLWSQDKYAKLNVPKFSLSHMSWVKKAYYSKDKSAAQMNQTPNLTNGDNT